LHGRLLTASHPFPSLPLFRPAQSLETFADGSRKQVNTDGTSILLALDGVITQTDKEGVTIVTNPDSSFTQTSPDGTSISVGADGHRVQTFVDGSQIESFTDGTSIEIHADGHRITIKPDGSKQQVNPDGTTLNFNAAGVLVGDAGAGRSLTSGSGSRGGGGPPGVPASKAKKKKKKKAQAKYVGALDSASSSSAAAVGSSSSDSGSATAAMQRLELDEGVWEKRQDAKKRTYYFMRSQGKTAWELPHGWVKMLDAGTDRVYWYNRDTQESSWEDPNPPPVPALPRTRSGGAESPSSGGGAMKSTVPGTPPPPSAGGPSEGGSLMRSPSAKGAAGAGATKRPSVARGRAGSSSMTAPFATLAELDRATAMNNLDLAVHAANSLRISSTGNTRVDGLYDANASGNYINQASRAVLRLDPQGRWIIEARAGGAPIFTQKGLLPWSVNPGVCQEGRTLMDDAAVARASAPILATIERTRVGTLLKQGGARSGKGKFRFLERLFELRGTVLRYWKPSRKVRVAIILSRLVCAWRGARAPPRARSVRGRSRSSARRSPPPPARAHPSPPRALLRHTSFPSSVALAHAGHRRRAQRRNHGPRLQVRCSFLLFVAFFCLRCSCSFLCSLFFSSSLLLFSPASRSARRKGRTASASRSRSRRTAPRRAPWSSRRRPRTSARSGCARSACAAGC
jgi:hypothetical protein